LIWFVLFIWLIWFIWLVSFNPKPDRPDKPNKPNNSLLPLADFFSILLVVRAYEGEGIVSRRAGKRSLARIIHDGSWRNR
jgi:hypothetical protein